MQTKALKVTLLFLVLSCASGCEQSIATDSANRQRGTSEQTNLANPNNKVVGVGAVEFFASWGGSYVKLERWKDTSDPKVPHPEVLDVVCVIENKGDSAIQRGDFIVLTTIDAIVAPTYLHSGDVNKIIGEVSWARVAAMDDVKLEVVPYLEPKRSTKVKIEGLKLGTLLKQFNGEGDTLWPWALRVNVRVLTRDIVQVATGQAILQIIPADSRLIAK